MATSYEDKYSKGDRTSLINVSASSGLFNDNKLMSTLVDGKSENNLFFNNGGSLNKWIKFDFSKSILIDEITIKQVKTDSQGVWSIQGSNNDTDWDVILSSFALGGVEIQIIPLVNTKKYRYIRFMGISGTTTNSPYILEYEFKAQSNNTKYLIQNENNNLFKVVGGYYTDNLIPKMTSNTTPNGIAFADSEYDNNYMAYKIFDKTKTAWCSTAKGKGYVGYEFENPICISKYAITAYDSGSRVYDPKSWTFEGGNDGVNWTVLDKRENEVDWKSAEKREYIFNNNMSFKKYRINIVSVCNSIATPCITELEMMEKVKLVITNLEQVQITEELFKTQGMDNPPIITEEVINQIGDFKILKWTDSGETNQQLNLKGEYKDKLFKLIEGAKLLIWADDISKNKCDMVYKHKPYRPIDILRANGKFKILMGKERQN